MRGDREHGQTRRTGALRCGPIVLLVLLVGALTSGCLNATASLSIDENDRVSGDVLIAVPRIPGREPPQLQAPPMLRDRVEITPYRTEGSRGSTMSFDNLTFSEVERLGKALSPTGSRYRLDLSRAGSLVVVEGAIDLTPLAETDSKVVLEISTPGEVTTTNGRISAGVVTWRPEPGEVTRISATFQFTNTQQAGWYGWAALVGGITLAVALIVAMLALWTHHRMRKEAVSGR